MSKRVSHNSIVILLLCFSLHLFASGQCYGAITFVASSMKKASEYEIKAVYVYNFLLFAKWPDSDEKDSDDEGEVGELCIGIVGKDPFGDSFSGIEGKVIKSMNKKLVIKRYGSYKKGLGLDDCRILFICNSETGRLSLIVKELEGAQTLTVADTAGFLKYGGMINLVKVEKKIRWEINRAPLKKANIQLSSQLFRNAVNIVEIAKKTKKEKEKEVVRRTRR